MRAKRNKIFIYPLIMLTAISLQQSQQKTVTDHKDYFLAPKSNIKTTNNNLFKYIYETILNSENTLPLALKNEIIASINNNQQENIKQKIAEFFPTNSNIYQNYTWTEGFSLIIGFNLKTNQIIILPTSQDSGKDTGLKKPLFTNMNSLSAANNIAKLIEEKYDEKKLKEHIIKSGIDTIGGFLFGSDLYEKHKILTIYINLFLIQHPKKTIYNLIDNTFEIDNPYSIALYNSVVEKIGADKTLSIILNIIEEQKKANRITSNASNILLEVIAKSNNEVLFKHLNNAESTHIKLIIQKLAKEAPQTFIRLAELFLMTAEHKASPAIKNHFIKNIAEIKPTELKPLLLKLEHQSQNENIRSLAKNLIINLGLNPYKSLFATDNAETIKISYETPPSEIYNNIIQTISNTKRSAVILPLLQDLNQINSNLLPDTLPQDMLDFINTHKRMREKVAIEALALIAKKNNKATADILLKIITEDQYSESIKNAAITAIASMNGQYILESGIKMLFDKSTDTNQRLSILAALNNVERMSIKKESWIPLQSYAENKNHSKEEIKRALYLIAHINNKEGINYILEEELYFAHILKEEFIDILKFAAERISPPQKLIAMAFSEGSPNEIVMTAFKRLKNMNLNTKSITTLFDIMTAAKVPQFQRNLAHILIQEMLETDSYIIIPLIQKTIYDKSKADDFLVHVTLLELLENLSPKDITQDIIDMLAYADNNTMLFEGTPYRPLREKFIKIFNSKHTNESTPSYNKIPQIIEKFTKAKNEDEAFNTLIELDQATDDIEDKSHIPTLLAMIKYPMMEKDELIIIGKIIAKAGSTYRKQLANFLLPELLDTDKHPEFLRDTYTEILKTSGFSHKLLLWKKALIDWQKFGISSKDIIKGYLHAKNKQYFIDQFAQIVNIDSLNLKEITWTNPSQYLANETFMPINTITEDQFKIALQLLYKYMDTETDSDILLGEEYEIKGRENVPSRYYGIYEESNDENEIITPPSNPLYQRIFNQHIPHAYAGVHRTLEQRVNNMDAKLINLFCQLYSMGTVSRNIVLGKELNPKEEDLWTIRYNHHEGQNYGEGKFLLQTTDWKTHTSGSLMWFFMTYADKYPLKWIKLKNLLLKKLNKHNINIYDFDETGDEKRISTQKKHKDNQANNIPKYIYKLTQTPINKDACVMRLLINDEEIIDSLTDMILYTSDNIVKGTITEKKLYAIDTINELYNSFAMGEIPDNFAHYRTQTAMANTLDKIEKYFKNKEDALTLEKANQLIGKST